MRLLYIANARLPTDNAHGVQIVKTCEAFAKGGTQVTLARPWRINWIKEDVYTHYRVERTFRIVTLPALDVPFLGRFGFWLQTLSFSILVFFYVLVHRFDIVYSRDEVPLLFASLANTSQTCVTKHKSDLCWESHTGRYNALIAQLLKRIEGLVVITEGLRDFYREKGMSDERIMVAPDAVALEDFALPQSREESRARLGLPQGEKIALCISNKITSIEKGVRTLCAAGAFLPEGMRVAVIGGEQEEIAELKKDAPRVLFLGWRPYAELANNQQAGDVLVLPNSAQSEVSAKFTSPLKLFTYMASGIPIVASDLPSIREVLDDTSAFFFTPDDPKSLAEKIEYVFTHRDEAEKRANSAKWDVQQYTWEKRVSGIFKSACLDFPETC